MSYDALHFKWTNVMLPFTIDYNIFPFQNIAILNTNNDTLTLTGLKTGTVFCIFE